MARTPTYFLTHAGNVLALRFAADDRLCSVGEDGHLRLWDLSARKEEREAFAVEPCRNLRCFIRC